MKPVRTLWLDTVGGAYPVFDVKRGSGGRDGRFTYPDRRGAAATRRERRGPSPRDMMLVGSGGHLHPGGLWTDLYVTRNGRKTRLFRSEAKYYEPAGAVSWDVAMTVTPPDWRVQLRKGDVARASRAPTTASARPGTSRWRSCRRLDAGGTGAPTRSPRTSTSGRGHPRPPARERQPRRRAVRAPEPARPARRRRRGQGHDRGLHLRPRRSRRHRRRGRPPVVRRGRRLTFVNRDAPHDDLAHDHRLQGAVQARHRHRLPARRRQGRLRLRRAGLRPARRHRRRRTATLDDAEATWRPAPTPTSAASTRSCAGRSG